MSSSEDLLSQPLLLYTQQLPRLGVGATVVAKHGVKKPLSATQLLAKRAGKKVRQSREEIQGVVVKSAPDKSWIVYWYSIQKTSKSKFNQLRAVANPSSSSQEYATELAFLGDAPVDFATDKLLRDYIDQKQNDLDYKASGGKMPAAKVTPGKTPAFESPRPSLPKTPPFDSPPPLSSPRKRPADPSPTKNKKQKENSDDEVFNSEGK